MAPNPIFADISSNNAEFFASEYRAAGHIIVAIKATEGVRYVNPEHNPWCHDAQHERIAVIHYHFARPDLGDTPEVEANHFVRTAVPLTAGRDYLAVDIERATPQGWVHDPAWTQRFDGYVREHSRFSTILYANKSTLMLSDQWLVNDKKRVWEADWSTDHDYAPKGYIVAARQQSDGATGPLPHSIAGVGPCDVNAARRQLFTTVLNHL